MVLVIECVDALVDRERDERGAIGGGEGTRGEDGAETGADLGKGLVRRETTRVRLATEARGHVRQLVGNAAALEIAPHRGAKYGARLAGKGRDIGERCA